MRRIRPRLTGLAVVVASVIGSTLALAAPAHAVPSLTINQIATLNPDGTITVSGTYSCDGGGSGSLTNDLTDETHLGATGEASTNIACDGIVHTWSINVPDSNPAVPYQKGDRARVVVNEQDTFNFDDLLAESNVTAD
ncbi:hypothetical protein GCM10022403_087500 [Streptomyces coacervatus]|uniref:DUF6299 domain-containing protein n=1 Tax=Streptomyces coacervatus TaxID=647381 RepID=A0ABP7JCZ8_9ACTN|nr:DUF6299 family protein [Streptomyces coacervatus]MDF2273513.1 DUF6299 family protein [Streptomyces coacervatus]